MALWSTDSLKQLAAISCHHDSRLHLHIRLHAMQRQAFRYAGPHQSEQPQGQVGRQCGSSTRLRLNNLPAGLRFRSHATSVLLVGGHISQTAALVLPKDRNLCTAGDLGESKRYDLRMVAGFVHPFAFACVSCAHAFIQHFLESACKV